MPEPSPQSRLDPAAAKAPAAKALVAKALVERVALAADALRAGRPVALAGDACTMLAVETAGEASLARLRAGGALYLVLSHARAQTLRIPLYTPKVVALPLDGETAEALRAIADPTADLAHPLKGPFAPRRDPLPPGFAAGVELAKYAGLLPAIVACEGALDGAAALSAADIENYDDALSESLVLVARARVPLEGAEKAELAAFRSGDGAPENYAILIGNPPTDRPVLARLHSECFTGDLLGSLKCDCGAQLRGAIETISRAGGGVLLYLAQEGRGIGLVNKLRAYRLQDQGFDTMEANERLGFAEDERVYGIAARMLALLGFGAVRLLTNNPDKVKSLEAHGIKVAERVPHAFPANAHNRAYLATKAKKGGHLF